jgi:hypothetical protein
MKQSLKGLPSSGLILPNFLEWNPQLFREFKGKLKPRNIIITAAISVITQFLITVSFLGQLPEPITDPLNIGRQYSRYCATTVNYYDSNPICQTDLANNWLINWQLLWFDLFVALSFVGIFSLLVIGTYMLITDMVKEETRGTLNFIRLTPQSANSVLFGKILGVPLLLYLGVLLAFPLHLVAGLGAKISLSLILGFDAAIIASCAFFYGAAMVWSLLNSGLSGFKPWLAGGAIFVFLFAFGTRLLSGYSYVHNHTFDGFILFHPGVVLSYLAEATALPQKSISLLDSHELGKLLFYGQSLWTKASLGIGFVLLNFGLWTYWLWSVLKRRFHNPQSTLLSKTQSYWLTGWFVFMTLGFTLQVMDTDREYSISDLDSNFMMLQLLMVIFFLGLIAALSPHRQSLYDWARYRHQQQKDGHLLWKELIVGENSPATIAIAINLLIALTYITPSLLIFSDRSDSVATFWGLLIGANMILFYSAIAQLMLTMKHQKRAIWTTITVLAAIIVPLVCFAIGDIQPSYEPGLWLFSFMPLASVMHTPFSTVIMSILGQWLAIAATGFYLTKKLNKAGASETKMLFGESN